MSQNTQANGTTITAALPAGTNNIGDVDILTIAAGDNNIGNVDIVTLPALATGANVIGALTANQSVNNAQIAGVATSTGNGVVGTGVQRVAIASDNSAVPVSGPITNAQYTAVASTLAVTTTGAVSATITCTLPAVAAQFHYITSIHISLTANAAIAAAAGAVIVTTTNITGTPAWDVQKVAAASTMNKIAIEPQIPIRSAVVNTATTIVAPVVTNGIWRITVTYYTGA